MNKKDNTHRIFFILSVVLLLYMAYSTFMAYKTVQLYCTTYQTTMGAVWSYALQTILASIIPCLVYAFTMYGIGVLLKPKDTVQEHLNKIK